MFGFVKKKKTFSTEEAQEKIELSPPGDSIGFRTKVNRSPLFEFLGFRLGSMLFFSRFRVGFSVRVSKHLCFQSIWGFFG